MHGQKDLKWVWFDMDVYRFMSGVLSETNFSIKCVDFVVYHMNVHVLCM